MEKNKTGIKAHFNSKQSIKITLFKLKYCCWLHLGDMVLKEQESSGENVFLALFWRNL